MAHITNPTVQLDSIAGQLGDVLEGLGVLETLLRHHLPPGAAAGQASWALVALQNQVQRALDVAELRPRPAA